MGFEFNLKKLYFLLGLLSKIIITGKEKGEDRKSLRSHVRDKKIYKCNHI